MRAALFAVVLASACAHTEAQQPARRTNERTYVTGARIARPVDPSTGLPRTFDNVRIYGRERLEETGRMDVKSALHDVDPSL